MRAKLLPLPPRIGIIAGLLAIVGLLLLQSSASVTASSLFFEAPVQNSLPPNDPTDDLGITDFLADGQFVYGPNVGDFSIVEYLSESAPHLLPYAEQLYGRAEYYSINPKIYLTLMEMTTHLVSNRRTTVDKIENPFGFNESGFVPQLDGLSILLVDAYYRHLYTISPLPIEKRNVPSLSSADGSRLPISVKLNAVSYAIGAALAPLSGDASRLATALDKAATGSFYQTYRELFTDDDPLDEANHIYIPGLDASAAAPPGLLQLPFPRGESWQFNGVHGAQGAFWDMSSLDFTPNWSTVVPGTNTSGMWVVAAAGGTPVRDGSSCQVKILHQDGWETVYFHLENMQSFGGTVSQNDRLGVLANTYDEATCWPGVWTKPHLHFTLKHNGAWVALDGTRLSGWSVHSSSFG